MSTPRIDCYSASKSELSDATQGVDTSTGTYHPSVDIPSNLLLVHVYMVNYFLLMSDNAFLQI